MTDFTDRVAMSTTNILLTYTGQTEEHKRASQLADAAPAMLDALRELVAEHDTRAEKIIASSGFILPDTGGIELARAVLATIEGDTA